MPGMQAVHCPGCSPATLFAVSKLRGEETAREEIFYKLFGELENLVNFAAGNLDGHQLVMTLRWHPPIM